tara:strand:+ start:208 stop:1236 length:1029 start_codon:yes stop_codon:yes gene_type:complete
MRNPKSLKIANESGSTLTFTNFGASLKSWVIKLNDKTIVDIVLGYKNEINYKTNPLYLGSIAGRYANRISNGRFNLNNINVNLTQNDNGNHLHGGHKGFSSKHWDIVDHKTNTLILSLESRDQDENYPGTLKTTVSYTINDLNELKVEFHAFSDMDTIINLTQHSYFNLNGNIGGDILDHKIKINSNQITEIDNQLIPTGKFLDVKDTPLDLRNFTRIGKMINQNFQQINFAKGYDHNFVLSNNKAKNIKKVAELIGDKTKIKMCVKTDLPGLQFYSGNFLDGSYEGKNGFKLTRNSGLCLEPQYFPDSPNHTHFPSTILRKGDVYAHNIIYGLSNLKTLKN